MCANGSPDPPRVDEHLSYGTLRPWDDGVGRTYGDESSALAPDCSFLLAVGHVDHDDVGQFSKTIKGDVSSVGRDVEGPKSLFAHCAKQIEERVAPRNKTHAAANLCACSKRRKLHGSAIRPHREQGRRTVDAQNRCCSVGRRKLACSGAAAHVTH